MAAIYAVRAADELNQGHMKKESERTEQAVSEGRHDGPHDARVEVDPLDGYIDGADPAETVEGAPTEHEVPFENETAHTGGPSEAAIQLEEVQEALETARDRHLRLAAEFDNFRKRMDGELTAAWTRAQAELVGKLVEGLDDLRRVGAFEASNTTVEALIEGVDLVERKILQALEAAGLVMFDPAGEPFDPNTMEAMMKVQTEDESEDDRVHEVFQRGYTFKGQLVRPARVSVLKQD